MAKNIHFLDRYKEIITTLAEKFDLTYEEVFEIIDHFFITLKKFLTDVRMPTIKISKWGTFKPSIGWINWYIQRALWHMSRDQGDRDKMFRKIRVVQRVKDRILQEKQGVNTWKTWKNLKEEELEAESKDW